MNKLYFLIIAVLFLHNSAIAAKVVQVKGNQAIVETDLDALNEGDEFFLINPETNKKAGIIKIKKIKGIKALGEVLKGRAAEGFTLMAKSSDSPSPEAKFHEKKLDSALPKAIKNSYGLVGGYIMSSMNANVTYKSGNNNLTTPANMTGTGFAIGGYYDVLLSPDFVGRGYAALEQFSVTGAASAAACNGSSNCDANINYLSFYGLGKYYLTQTRMRHWLGGGAGYLIALSKSSSALNTSQISSNQVFTIAYGLDYQSSRKNYIPLSLEYNMFPDSETVKASQILIKAGWAWNL